MDDNRRSPYIIMFGILENHDAFETTKQDLEQVLGVTFEVGDSSFYGYGEYAFFSEEGYSLSLIHNWDDYDKEPIEEKFADYKLLFEISVRKPYPDEKICHVVTKLDLAEHKWVFLQKRIYR